MAASADYVSLLLLLAVAPLLSGIEASAPEEILVFGMPTLSLTVDPATLWFGEMIDAVETKAGIPELSFQVQGGTFKRLFLQLQPRLRLFQLVLLGPDGSTRAKLLFRFSDLYLLGFANQDDDWFAMKGAEDWMPGATVLNFDFTYTDLLRPIGKGTFKQKLAQLGLGMAPTLAAVSNLATNHPSNQNPGLELSLALFAITVSESLRLIPIREKIGSIFESGTTGYLDDKIYDKYIHNWGRLSIFLLCSIGGRPLGDNRGYRELKTKIRVEYDYQALPLVAILKWPNDYDPENLVASCDERKRTSSQGLP